MPKVEYSADALADLRAIFDFIAAEAGARRAEGYVEGIQDRCDILAVYPHIGRLRSDLGAGVRLLPAGRRVIVLYRSLPGTVLIGRVYYGGRDVRPWP